MSDVTCRGSFALGTACGRCSKCKAQIEEYGFKKTVRERLDGTAALRAELETARRGALEEAAKVCQRISNTDLAATNPPYEEGYSDAADACFHAIRALIAQEDAATDRGAQG